MKKSLLLKTLLCILVISGEGISQDLESMIEKGTKVSSLVAQAVRQEKEFRSTTITQLKGLVEEIRVAQTRPDCEAPEAWKGKILEQIEDDRKVTTTLNEQLKSAKGASFPLKTHKIIEILTGVESLIKESFFDLIEGRLPEGYAYDQETITVLGGENTSTVWGNSRGTYLKTALFYIMATAEEGNAKSFGARGVDWFDQSALAHIIPLPKDLSGDPFSSYSFLSAYSEGVNGLIVLHSGYAFGGHRNEPRYPKGKLFGPQDCSSWIATLTGAPAYTTADQLCAYRKLPSVGGFIPQGWETGADAKYLLNNMSAVKIQDPSVDIRAGQIYAFRRFSDKDPTMTETLGAGGHTALVLGFNGQDIVTLGYNRDMPKIEGFGVQNFLWGLEPLKTKMLFDVKESD